MLQASVLTVKNSQGQIFMLNMGQPVKIVDLAKDLIRLSGYEAGKDIEIVFTGLRPGEKLYEELLVEGEEYDSTAHEKVLVVKNASRIVPQDFDLTIDILCEAAQNSDTNLIIFLLDQLVVGYKTKYQRINVENAQGSLEKIISQACDLNPITASLQGEFASELSLPNTYSKKLTSKELDQGLKRALENQEFSLYYQPVMNLQTGKIKEFEALLRWNHPQLGLIMPQRFMGAAEKSGLLVPIERWIIESVCMQLKSWQEDSTFASDVGVSINIPSQAILQNSLVKHLSYNIERYEIDPKLVSLEISEYILGENPQVAMNILPELKRLGIQLQIDNFGRVASLYGHIQPNLLYREFDRVKIDRHLMSRIEKESLAWEVLQDIVIGVENYGLEITATGIENIPQLNKVKGILCEYGQGYYLNQPLKSSEVIKLMAGKSQAMFNRSN